MKVVGLITEYNPFHNGHKYHIEQALQLTGADAALVVMRDVYKRQLQDRSHPVLKVLLSGGFPDLHSYW